jgi:hypothetical protein
MTTIAWDGNILAADSRLTRSDKILKPHCKIYIHKNRAFAEAGLNRGAEILRKLYIERGKILKWHKDYGQTSMTIISHETQMTIASSMPGGDNLQPGEADGSGYAFAEGCMRCGLNAHDTVVMTAKWDTCTGDEVNSISLQQLKALPSDFEGWWHYTYKDNIRRIIRDYRDNRTQEKRKNNRS